MFLKPKSKLSRLPGILIDCNWKDKLLIFLKKCHLLSGPVLGFSLDFSKCLMSFHTPRPEFWSAPNTVNKSSSVSLTSNLKLHQCSREPLEHSPATRHGFAAWKAMGVFKPSLQGMVLMSCCVATQQPCLSISIFNITKCSPVQVLGFQLTIMQYKLPGNSVTQQWATELSLSKCKINKYYTWQDF